MKEKKNKKIFVEYTESKMYDGKISIYIGDGQKLKIITTENAKEIMNSLCCILQKIDGDIKKEEKKIIFNKKIHFINKNQLDLFLS